MNKKNSLFVIIASTLAVLVYLAMLVTNGNSTNETNNYDILQEVKGNAKDFVKLSEMISSILDTNFYAEYRTRPDSFYFFYLTNDQINGSFRPQKNQFEVFELAKEIGVKKVWKYGSENFYRFELRKSFRVRPQVIVLKHSEKQFIFRNDSKISKARKFSSEDDLRDNSEGLYKLNELMLIYF